MKKILLSVLSLVIFGALSQAQTGIQVRAGVNFQNLNGKIMGDKTEGKLKTGFHAGVEVPISIAPEFYIQPGVLYSMKGAVDKDNSDFQTSLSYVEVPVNFVYKPMLGTGHLILGVGPYVGIGVSGKIKDGDDDVSVKFENEISATQLASGDPYFRRTDFGGNLLAGYQFANNLLFQLNAQLGMTNVFPKVEGISSDDYKLKNTGFGLSVGYIF